MLDKHDSRVDRIGETWMLAVAGAAIALVFAVSWLFPEQDAEHGISVWHALAELEARFVKATIALGVLFFVCSVVFGPKAIQQRMSPSYDELGDIMELNKEVYRDAAKGEDRTKKITEVLPYLNVAALAAAIQSGCRWLGISLILASLMRLA